MSFWSSHYIRSAFFAFLLFAMPAYSALSNIQTQLNIDWTNYRLLVHSFVPVTEQVPLSERTTLHLKVKEDTLSQTSRYLENLPIDSSHSVADLLDQNDLFAREYSSFLENIRTGNLFLRGDKIESNMLIPLRGENGLLSHLPVPWKRLRYQVLQEPSAEGGAYQTRQVKGEYLSSNPMSYSGLVIDVREFPLKPAMLPRIYSQDGRLIYGPEYLSRSIGNERGIAGYVKSYSNPEVLHRAGMQHYFTVAMSIKGKYKTDIVLSNSDAKKILSNPISATSLRKARVIFIVK